MNDRVIAERMEANVSFSRAIGISFPMRGLQAVATCMLSAYYRPFIWVLRVLEPSDAKAAEKTCSAKSRSSASPDHHNAIKMEDCAHDLSNGHSTCLPTVSQVVPESTHHSKRRAA